MKNRLMNILNAKQKRNGTVILLAAFLIVGVLSGLVACTVAEQNPFVTEGLPNSDYVFENMGYKVPLPDEYRDKVTLLPSPSSDLDTIITAYQSATFDQRPNGGFLFCIVRHTPAEFEDYWPGRDIVGGSYHFAKDEEYYYSVERPTDVQANVDEMEEYQALAAQVDTILSWFIAANDLAEYDHEAEVYGPEYTYPGMHAIFSVTLSNEAKFEVVLSKPIRQGEDGIWCVERMYDEYENLYIAMPETDLTAMEYYTQLQAEADDGHRPGLLDVEDVALIYLENVWDYARHIKDFRITYIRE